MRGARFSESEINLRMPCLAGIATGSMSCVIFGRVRIRRQASGKLASARHHLSGLGTLQTPQARPGAFETD
jgi:hypothetical protein